MSLYALTGGQRTRATRDGPRQAGCADCTQPMIAKTGDVVIWHWAHRTENPNCEAARETPWHLAWKDLGAPGTQERKVGDRRADILAPGGYAVEFQHSALSGEEVTARERDWKDKLIWIFDVQDAYASGRLELRTHPDRTGDAYRNVRWSHALDRVKAAACRTLLDLNGEQLLYVGRWFDRSPLTGYGWIVTRDWVRVNVLEGGKIVDPPGWQQHVDEQALAAKAAAAARWRERAWRLNADRAQPETRWDQYLAMVRAAVASQDRRWRSCPLCDDDHPSCRFTHGTTLCIKVGCANPHHRPTPPMEETS